MEIIANITNATVLDDSFTICEVSTISSMILAVLFIISEVMPFIGSKKHNNSLIQFIHEICSCKTKCKKIPQKNMVINDLEEISL